jgi:hypothetical protein
MRYYLQHEPYLLLSQVINQRGKLLDMSNVLLLVENVPETSKEALRSSCLEEGWQ